MTDPTPRPDVRELAKQPLHDVLHDLDVRIPNLPGDCHCNLVAEVVLDVLLPVLQAAFRRQVAEEIAADITETIGGYPGNEARRPHVDRGELLNDAHWAAAIARSHAHPKEITEEKP